MNESLFPAEDFIGNNARFENWKFLRDFSLEQCLATVALDQATELMIDNITSTLNSAGFFLDFSRRTIMLNCATIIFDRLNIYFV